VIALIAATLFVERQPKLPAGVIESYVWGSRQIPIHGNGHPGTEAIDFAIVDAMRKYGIVGCGVSVCKDDAVIYCKGFGYAELPDKPFLPTTATRCGSIAKPVTALCALYLMDRGGLKLDDKVIPILSALGIVPKIVDERVREITVRELMDHTSGLPAGATYTAWRPERNLIEALKLDRKPNAKDAALDALSNSHLQSAPGTHFQYANANFAILARVIEARSKMTYDEYLTRVAIPKFGAPSSSVFVSRDQVSPADPARNPNEAAYYQTSADRFPSFIPEEASEGQVFGEAYRGYSSECADGAGGIAISASGLGKILANLRSRQCAISRDAVNEILTPPAHYLHEKGFDRNRSGYYSKGFNVRFSGGVPWISHGGMTLHCGGIIGYNAGYQFAGLSNWNNSRSPFVDAILDRALTEAVAKIR